MLHNTGRYSAMHKVDVLGDVQIFLPLSPQKARWEVPTRATCSALISIISRISINRFDLKIMLYLQEINTKINACYENTWNKKTVFFHIIRIYVSGFVDRFSYSQFLLFNNLAIGTQNIPPQKLCKTTLQTMRNNKNSKNYIYYPLLYEFNYI